MQAKRLRKTAQIEKKDYGRVPGETVLYEKPVGLR